MSMPSSRLLVATTQGSRPRLRSSSMIARCSLETEPWWALAMTVPAPLVWPDWAITCAAGCGAASSARRSRRSPPARSVAISLSRAVSRSASRRELAKTMVERCCSTRSTTCSSTWGQMLVARLRVAGLLVVLLGGGHVLDGHDHPQVPLLLARGRHDLDRGAAAEEARDLLERAHRRAQPDALRRAVEEGVEALEGDREVGAALAAGDGVHLVEDDRVDAAQRLRAWLVSIRKSDSGVVIMMSGGLLVSLRRSAADVSPERSPTARSGRLVAEPLRGVPDAGERGAQVALDVDGQRLERRDVEDAGAAGLVLGPLGGEQGVDGVQEGAERLAAAGGRDHQRVLARGDGVPRTLLRRGGLARRRPRTRRGSAR